MHRLLAAISLACLVGANAALADTMLVTNNSGLPIDELFASAPGKKAWGQNLLEGVAEGALDHGKSQEVASLADGVYDLRISAPDEGILCYMSNVEIKGGKVELTKEMGANCQ